MVYFDPPYAPDARRVRSFATYQSGGFGEIEHRRLAGVFRDLCVRGCHVLLSNSDTPLVRELYDGFKMETVRVRRNMNAKAEGRAGWEELLITSERTVKPKRRAPKGQMELAFAPVVSRESIHQEIASALDACGLVPENAAIQRAAAHLREKKLLTYRKFLPGSLVDLNVRRWIDEAVARGFLLREGGAVRTA